MGKSKQQQSPTSLSNQQSDQCKMQIIKWHIKLEKILDCSTAGNKHIDHLHELLFWPIAVGLSGSSGHMKKCMQNAFFRYGMSWHIETKFHITSLVLLQRIYLFHHCYQVSLLQHVKNSPRLRLKLQSLKCFICLFA